MYSLHRRVLTALMMLGLCGVMLLAVSGCCCPIFSIREAAPTAPTAQEWLQPPAGSAPTTAGPALQAEYLGRIIQSQYLQSADVDLWRLSNNTSAPLAISYEIRKRDARGVLLETNDWSFCTKRSGDYAQLWRVFSMVPPGESIIVQELVGEDTGVTQELTTHGVAGCPFAALFNVTYDPNVQLVSFVPAADSFTIIVENSGSRAGFAVGYIVLYGQDGTPVYGDHVTLWGYQDIPLLTIPPGERMEFVVGGIPKLDEPEVSGYDIVFLGLSEPL